ncbi:YqaJ viral recombinase family protein [Streptomyces sp. NBC_00433]
MTDPTLPPLPAGQLVGWFEPGSDDWHAARAQGIGGSEISAVIGLSPFESRFSLWHRKSGLVAPVQESNEMYWGKKLEPAVCDEFQVRNPGWQALVAPTFHGTGRPWQIVNPDRIGVGPNGEIHLIEAKTSRDAEGWGEEGTDEVPVYYRAQCRWYLDGLGLQRCRLIVLISGSDYREYLVEADPAEAHMMRDRAEEFLRSVHAGERPPIDGHAATYQVVKELPDSVDDVDIEIAEALRDRYFTALDACKQAETEKRAAAGLVLDEIGTARRAVVGKQRIATRIPKPDGSTKSLQPARNREIAA